MVLGIVAAAVMAAAGCGSSPEPGARAPGTDAVVRTSPTDAGPPSVTLFFYEGEELVEVIRSAPVDGAELALRMMLDGPTADEAARGLASAVPEGTELNSFTSEGGTAAVDFSEEMSRFGGGAAWVQAIMTQVEKTVKANDASVRTVRITVEGVPAEEAIQP